MNALVTPVGPEASVLNRRLSQSPKTILVGHAHPSDNQHSNEMVIQPATSKSGKCTALTVGFISGISLAVFSLAIKLLAAFTPWSVILVGHGSSLIFVVAALLFQRTNPFLKDFLGIQGAKTFIRGFCHTFTHALEIFALQNLPIGNVSVILFSTPAYVALFAFFFLGERLSRLAMLCVLFNFLGSVLVARPEFLFGVDSSAHSEEPSEQHSSYRGLLVWPILAAFAANILDAGDMVLVRDSKDYAVTIVMFYQNLIPTITAAVVLVFVGYSFPLTSTNVLPFIGFIVIHLLDEFIFTHAFQLSDAAVSSLLRSSQIIWAYVLQIAVFRQLPSLIVAAGALLIVIAITLLISEEIVRERGFESLWHWLRSGGGRLRKHTVSFQEANLERAPLLSTDTVAANARFIHQESDVVEEPRITFMSEGRKAKISPSGRRALSRFYDNDRRKSWMF